MKLQHILVGFIALVVGVGVGMRIGGSGESSPDAAVPADTPESAAQPAASPAPAQAGAAQQTGISRTLFMTVDNPGSPTHEVVMGVAELPPGVAAGRHLHPGIEVGYILEGTVELTHEGREPVTVTAGGTFHNTAAHDARNVGTTPARILAVWIVEKGKPMSEPAP